MDNNSYIKTEKTMDSQKIYTNTRMDYYIKQRQRNNIKYGKLTREPRQDMEA